MELKNNISVYIEVAGSALSTLSIELLGKARQLADKKGEQVVAYIVGADTSKRLKKRFPMGQTLSSP